MIKGINKQVLEVTNPESPYFEKIVFFVKDSNSNLSENILKEEAEKISKTAQKPPKSKKSVKERVGSALFAFLGIGAGCALSFIISGLIK